MTAPSLPTALRAGAQGIYTLEAAAGLVIAHRAWLTRDDFREHIHHGTGIAVIDWEAAARSLASGALPCSAGERRLLQLAASLAGQAPVVLGDAVTGLDDHNIQVLVSAVLHASGRRQFP
jgi:ABC-type branched-subunit amino acid transport system ATPase component